MNNYSLLNYSELICNLDQRFSIEKKTIGSNVFEKKFQFL